MRRYERVLLLTASIVALVLAAGLSVAGGQPADGDDDDDAEEELVVHGDWRLRVLDPVAGVVNEVEFSNDLTPSGARVLTDMLTGASSPAGWSIRFFAENDGICQPTAPWCDLRPAGPVPVDDVGGSLVVVPSVSGDSFELVGEIEASGDGVIEQVETHLHRCQDSGPCEVSDVDADSLFTATGVSPVAVSAGQVVEIVVAISFD